jgi:hypothetical protein
MKQDKKEATKEPKRISSIIPTPAEIRRTVERVIATEESTGTASAIHNCMEYAVPYQSDGALGHGWECGKCGKFLQAG